MIYFPVKSRPNSANPSGISRYKIRKNNPLHFQHLQNSSDLFILKPLKPPLESTLTSHFSLTPLQSTLTKNRGEGGSPGISNQKLPEILLHSFTLFVKSIMYLSSFQSL